MQLAERSLSAEQFVALDAAAARDRPAEPRASTRWRVADREEALSDWLDEHGVDEAWRIAPPLAAAGVDVAWCERAAEVLDGDTLGPGLEWVAGTLSTRALLAEMKESTGRISALVGAVKSYSQLDRASVQLHRRHRGHREHARDARPQARATASRSCATTPPTLPRIEANPGELNQVWTNLIDNAIDAMDGARHAAHRRPRADGDARRRRDRRHRPGHAARRAGPRVRAVLHDEGRRQGHRSRPRHLAAASSSSATSIAPVVVAITAKGPLVNESLKARCSWTDAIIMCLFATSVPLVAFLLRNGVSDVGAGAFTVALAAPIVGERLVPWYQSQMERVTAGEESHSGVTVDPKMSALARLVAFRGVGWGIAALAVLLGIVISAGPSMGFVYGSGAPDCESATIFGRPFDCPRVTDDFDLRKTFTHGSGRINCGQPYCVWSRHQRSH